MAPGDSVSWLRPEQFFAISKMMGGTSLALPREALGQEVPRYILAGIRKSLIGGHSPTSNPHSSNSEDSLSSSVHLSPTRSQVAGEFKYHPECFACMSCKVIIEDGDAYALVQHATLYW